MLHNCAFLHHSVPPTDHDDRCIWTSTNILPSLGDDTVILIEIQSPGFTVAAAVLAQLCYYRPVSQPGLEIQE